MVLVGLNCKALRTGWQRGRGESREGLSEGASCSPLPPQEPAWQASLSPSHPGRGGAGEQVAEARPIFVLVPTATLQLEWKTDKWTSVHGGCQVTAVGMQEGRSGEGGAVL